MNDETRREQWAGTIFSTWVVVGLFLDGWAHNAGKPEDFFTPYHAVLYSGLVVGAAFYARERQRRRREGIELDSDPWILAGFVFFAIAGVGDGIWHTIFGVEEDVAALLSPTHLALMLGGLLLVTGPVRRARELPDVAGRWRTFLPVVAAIILAVSVVAFFLEFLSTFHVTDPEAYTTTSVGDHVEALHGVASVLVTNALLVGGLAWLLARWPRPPVGTVTAYLVATTLLLSGLLAFEYVALVLPAVVAGVAGDALLARGSARRTALIVVPAVLWPAWFAVFHTIWGIGWEVEIWTGSIVFAVLTGAGFDLMLRAKVPGAAGPPTPVDAPARVGLAGLRPAATRRGTVPVDAG